MDEPTRPDAPMPDAAADTRETGATEGPLEGADPPLVPGDSELADAWWAL